MEREDSYKAKDNIFYHEAGQIFQAEIMQNDSNETYIGYRLRLLKQVSGPRFAEIPLGGLEITVIKGQNASGSTWQVSRIPKPRK